MPLCKDRRVGRADRVDPLYSVASIQLRRLKTFAEMIKLDPTQMKALDEALTPGMISGRCYAD
ncbi:MAG TPA: hypothetical protein VGL12_00080 [Roseiarcus sp.]|jgi:hypothetical protein